METIPGPVATLWVCVDCLYAHHSGEPEHCTPGVEPWALIGDGYTVTDWTTDGADEDDEDNPSGVRDFSALTCEGCGTGLAGTRYRFALWAV